MGSHVIDSALFKSCFGTEEMRTIFSDATLLQMWLDVEAALAKAEGELGIIPTAAAAEIVKKAHVRFLDMEAMGKAIEKANHPIMPLVKQLERACDNSHGQYVHWGATTQDIMDTGIVLQMKQGLAVIERDVVEMLRILCALAETHTNTIMPGRTHGQHALPITFGYKVSIWLDEMNRNLARVRSLKSRVLNGQFFGAVGTLASLHKRGMEVQERMMRDLGLGVSRTALHAARDNWAEIASVLAILTGTIGKMAKEVIMLQKTEIAELEEPFRSGQVGSSTMPHKRNPMTCQNIVALSRIVRANSPLVTEGMVHEDERDMTALQVEWEVMPELFTLTGAALSMSVAVFRDLRVRPDNMKRNLSIAKDFILSEAIMIALGEKIGRQKSHDLVHKACEEALHQNTSLSVILNGNKEVTGYLSAEEIEKILSPENYIGVSVEMTQAVIENTKKILELS